MEFEETEMPYVSHLLMPKSIKTDSTKVKDISLICHNPATFVGSGELCLEPRSTTRECLSEYFIEAGSLVYTKSRPLKPVFCL